MTPAVMACHCQLWAQGAEVILRPCFPACPVAAAVQYVAVLWRGSLVVEGSA